MPSRTPAVDPVVQALTLTDVVVEAAVTALLLAFAVQANKRFGTVDPHELVELRGIDPDRISIDGWTFNVTG